MPDRCTVGVQGENVAAAALQRAGYTLITRRWRPHASDLRGEIDIIAQRGGRIVFVEVRSRLLDDLTPALESISARKRAQLLTLADAYLMAEGLADVEVCFMVMAVNPRTGQVEWVEDALDDAARW